MLMAQIEDLRKDCVIITHPYLIYFPRNIPSKSVTVGPGRVGPGWFTILDDSYCPKMVIKICFVGVTHVSLLIGTYFASLFRNNRLSITLLFQYAFSYFFPQKCTIFRHFCLLKNYALLKVVLESPHFKPQN